MVRAGCLDHPTSRTYSIHSLPAPFAPADRALVRAAAASPLASFLVFVLGTLGAAAVLPMWVAGDSVAALEWGRQLAAGELSSFAPGPTPHPLSIALATLLAPLGQEAAYDAMSIVYGAAAFGALLAAVFDIAARLGSALSGAFAVALMITSSPLLMAVSAAYLDPAFAALVLTAVALEVRRPGRAVAPLAVLAVAGFLRPEAWLLAGAYWLWVARRANAGRRVRLALLAAAGPAVWMAVDTVVMGDPIYSLHVTDTASEVFYRQFTVGENLREALRQMQAYVGLLGVAAAAIGVRSLLSAGRRRDAAAVAGVLAITLGWYGALLATGMSSNARYLLVPAAALCVLAGVATHARPSARPLSVAVALVLLVQVQQRVEAPAMVRDAAEPHAAIVDDAVALTRIPAAKALLADCRTLVAPGTGAMRFVAFFSGRPPQDWTVDASGRGAPDLFVAPANPTVQRLFLGRARVDRNTAFRVPEGMRPGPGNASWRLYVRRGGC